MVFKFFKSVLIIFGLMVFAVIVSVISMKAGFYLGMVLLFVPIFALFKPLPRIGLGHRAFSLSVAFFIGFFTTVINLGNTQAADTAAMATLKVEDPDAYLAKLEAIDTDQWLTELAAMDPDRHAAELEKIAIEDARLEEVRKAEAAATEEKRLIDEAAAEQTRLAEAEIAEQAAQVKAQADLVKSEELAASRAEERKAEAVKYLRRLDIETNGVKNLKTSNYTSGIDDITKGLLLLGVWTMLYEEGAEFQSDPAVTDKRAAFGRQLVAAQQRLLPALRDAYGPAMRTALWEADGSARTIGAGYRTVEFVSGSFARNANIKQIHTEVRPQLLMLRFTRAQYKWIKLASEFSYYTMEPPSDKTLAIWQPNGSFRVVK